MRELRADLARVFGAPIMDRGVWGVDVRSLDSGERLYSLNAGKLMMPASNMKILTVAAGAEVLGWDYRFTTTLETAGTIAGGVLRGDLFVRSNGDPSINTREGRADAVLYEWAQGLQAAGITSIEGRVIGDDQAFDDDGIGAGWAWDYLQYGYAAPVGALEFNENVATLTIAPGAAAGDPVFVRLTPGSGLAMLNRASDGARGLGRHARLPPPPRSRDARGDRLDARRIRRDHSQRRGRQSDAVLRASRQGRPRGAGNRGQRRRGRSG